MNPKESKALRRFCGAVLEYREKQPYKTHIKKVIEELNDGSVSDEHHDLIMEAIIMNTLNQKNFPFSVLQRKYGLPINHMEFGTLKAKFCASLAKRCGFPNFTSTSSFTKKDILDMLFIIADEANESITKDGSFNHQVAGVALKAIDQAMRIYSMDEEADPVSEIVMDDPSRRLGA